MTNLLIAFAGCAVILSGAPTMGAKALLKPSCIRIAHVGEEDKPIPQIDICLGRGTDAKLREDYKWEFRLEDIHFRKIEVFVLTAVQSPGETPNKGTPFGTFRLQWRLERASGERVLSRRDASSFLAGLEGVVRSLPNDTLTEVVSGVLKRIGGPAK